MKLTPAGRRALVAIAKGEAVRENITNLVAFGDLARLGLIEPNATRTRWRPTEKGRDVLVLLERAS